MIHTAFIILNLFILESLLSVDNAAVLAIMVKDLPNRQKKKALRYGILGAYVFRGLLLFFASWLIKIIWLKMVGGIYLLYLTYGHFSPKNDTVEEPTEANDSIILKFLKLKIGMSQLWATIVLVEIMDIAFSIDNIFAAVAISPSFWTVMAGVAIGILAMRMVASWFVVLIEKHPSLEASAFVVIGLLGVRLLTLGAAAQFNLFSALIRFSEQRWFDLLFSGLMMIIFFVPLLFVKKEHKLVPMLSKNVA